MTPPFMIVRQWMRTYGVIAWFVAGKGAWVKRHVEIISYN